MAKLAFQEAVLVMTSHHRQMHAIKALKTRCRFEEHYLQTMFMLSKRNKKLNMFYVNVFTSKEMIKIYILNDYACHLFEVYIVLVYKIYCI